MEKEQSKHDHAVLLSLHLVTHWSWHWNSRDIETVLYNLHMHIFSVLCSIFQYMCHRAVVAQAAAKLNGSRQPKSDYGFCLWIYFPGPWIYYQDCEY